MAWKKSPPDLVERFGEALPEDHAAQRRPMFGYPACFTGGKMFAGLFQDRLVLKLMREDDAKAIVKAGGEPFQPMPGRKPMAAFFLAPTAVSESVPKMRRWITVAFDGMKAATATPKKKPTKKKTAPKK